MLGDLLSASSFTFQWARARAGANDGETEMRRALLLAGAALIVAGPAFAASDVTIEKNTTTTTTTTKDIPESGSTVSTVVVAPNPPPPPRVEMPPPPPGPGVVWIKGHWGWSPDTHTYVWSPGIYREPPREHAAWLPGNWIPGHGGWVWEEGRWD
jgi:hypothetical protein